ncbi:hypothetical protein C4705_23105, partial [Salmonella enterica subsp. enterica serovar Javiana]
MITVRNRPIPRAIILTSSAVISIHTGETPVTPHFSLEVVHGHRPLATMHIQFISEDMSTPCI